MAKTIVPIVGNTDGELWRGTIYYGSISYPNSVDRWWGYYGDWQRRSNFTEDLVSASPSDSPRSRYGISLYVDPWTGQFRSNT